MVTWSSVTDSFRHRFHFVETIQSLCSLANDSSLFNSSSTRHRTLRPWSGEPLGTWIFVASSFRIWFFFSAEAIDGSLEDSSSDLLGAVDGPPRRALSAADGAARPPLTLDPHCLAASHLTRSHKSLSAFALVAVDVLYSFTCARIPADRFRHLHTISTSDRAFGECFLSFSFFFVSPFEHRSVVVCI